MSEIKKYINSNTKVLIISHILWNYGYKVPIKEVSEQLKSNKNESFLIVDGAQTFGHIEIHNEVKYADLYSITSHKWACGPEGLGAIYVSDRFISYTDPTIIGWKSLKYEKGIYESDEDFLHEDARKFEIATSCIPLLSGLRESIALLEKDFAGNEKSNLIKRMSKSLWFELNQIKNINPILNHNLLNGIVSFDVENITNKNEIVRKLGEKNIWIRVVEDPKWFRVCIHQMTTEKEINILVKEIQKLVI